MSRLGISLLNPRTCTWTLGLEAGTSNCTRVFTFSPSNTRSLFLCSFGRKLLRPKQPDTLNNDGTAILYSIGYEQWKDKRARKLWDGDFIEYQNYLQINVLKELLNIPSMKADIIVQKYPIFHFTDAELIRDSFDYLTKRDVNIERLLRMPSLLAINAGTIETKSKQIMKLLDIATFNAVAPFLELQHNRLYYLSKLWKSELKHMKDGRISNRLYYLSTHLKCEPFEVADMMRKLPSLMSMSFTLLTEKLQLLIDSRIQQEDIVKDPYVFSQNLESIKHRLEMCQNAKLPCIKPWMLRCQSDRIEDHIRRMNLEEELLASHGDIIGYLQDALKCDSAQIHELFTRVPTLKTATAIKLNEMIQYLYSNEFTASDIMNNPYILLHSQATVEERLSELNSFGYETKQLPSILCWSTRRYKNFIRSLMAQELSLAVKSKLNMQ